MQDNHSQRPTSYEAFIEAFEELLGEYLDAALEEAGLGDAQVEQLMAFGWDAGRAAGLKELKAYDPAAHNLVSCRCWCCEVVQVVGARWWTPSFGRS